MVPDTPIAPPQLLVQAMGRISIVLLLSSIWFMETSFAQENEPTLLETIAFIQEMLPAHGHIRYTAPGEHDTPYHTLEEKIQYVEIEEDSEGCVLGFFKYEAYYDKEGYPSSGKRYVLLVPLYTLDIDPESGVRTAKSPKSGLVSIHLPSQENKKYMERRYPKDEAATRWYSAGSSHELLYINDEEMAEKLADALRHAAWLCGAHEFAAEHGNGEDGP